MTKQDELQKQMVKTTIEFYKTKNRGYLDLAMRFGKCKTSIGILNKLCKDGEVLIAYPDNKLRQTWIDECGLWGYDNPNITHVNFSSLKKHIDVNYDFFIIDEFHSASENERDLCFDIMSNCKYTLGLSGTVSDETKLDWGMEEIAQYSTLQGISDGILADYTITVHTVGLDDIVKTKDKKGKLKTEKQRYDGYTWVIENLKRQGSNFMHLALARNRLSLSSLGKTNYLKQLLKKLHDKRVVVFTGLAKVADDLGIPSYHSKSPNDDAFTGFQALEHNHLALAAMGKVGVTYKELDSVILLNFVYSAEENAQILNRCIRLDYKGKVADMHVICLNEPPEIKKIKEGLSLLDSSRIIWKYQ